MDWIPGVQRRDAERSDTPWGEAQDQWTAEVYRAAALANEPFQTTVCALAEEIRHLSALIQQEDEETLRCENLKLKKQLQKKEMEIKTLRARLKVREGFAGWIRRVIIAMSQERPSR